MCAGGGCCPKWPGPRGCAYCKAQGAPPVDRSRDVAKLARPGEQGAAGGRRLNGRMEEKKENAVNRSALGREEKRRRRGEGGVEARA